MAIYKQKGSNNWWFKFTWRGERIRESTRQPNKRVAEQIEAARKTQLAKGEVGIRDRSLAPTLHDFIRDKFMPHIVTTKADKPRTVVFYGTCAANLTADPALSALRLDSIKSEHTTAFIEWRRANGKKVSTINRDLATLRRLLRLAVEWQVITALPLVKLLGGESTRDRVLTVDDEECYLTMTSGPLHTIAAIMLDCGLRPEECHRLRWDENVSDGAIEIHRGKRDGSRRRIAMTDRVRALLASIEPRDPHGWVFPAPTKSGHVETSSFRKQHTAAVKAAKLATFVLYSLRHTCLTRWARASMDPFTLKYLAGHKSLTTTMRYIHLAGADAQERLQETRAKMTAGAKGRHRIRHSRSNGLPRMRSKMSASY